jgi:hypothetical protein
MFYLLTRNKFVGVRVSKGDALGLPLELTYTPTLVGFAWSLMCYRSSLRRKRIDFIGLSRNFRYLYKQPPTDRRTV